MNYRPTDPPGIYAIINTVNGKRYIGSATQPKHRWCWHQQYLRRGAHPNSHLQASVNKYGLDVFVFQVVELVSDHFWLRAREQAWILRERTTNQAQGYNRVVDAFGGLISDEAQENHRQRTREGMAQPHVKVKLSAGQRRRFACPTLLAEHRANLARPEVGQKHAAQAQARLADPQTRSAWIQASHSPTASAKRSASLVEANKSPELKAKRSASQRERRERERQATPPEVLAERIRIKRQNKTERQRLRRALAKQVA